MRSRNRCCSRSPSSIRKGSGSMSLEAGTSHTRWTSRRIRRMAGAPARTSSFGSSRFRGRPSSPSVASTSPSSVNLSSMELLRRTPSSKRKRVRSVSARRRAQMAEFSLIATKYLSDHPVCERCGKRPSVDPHHIVPRSVAPGKILDPRNLIALCRSCHNWVMSHPKEAREHGYLKFSTDP